MTTSTAEKISKFFRVNYQKCRNKYLLKRFEMIMDRINATGEVNGVRLCFLDLFPSHHQFSGELIKQVALRRPVCLLVSDRSHPAYRKRNQMKNVHVFLLDKRWLSFCLNWLRIPYLVTPASHLHPSSVRPELLTVHLYHSLVSMHAVYGDDAFDTYTHFFACGPHHEREVKAIKLARGLRPATVFQIGYPKLDELAFNFEGRKSTSENRKTILLAPSWHPENLLKMHGDTICHAIMQLGYKLIIRPHPHLFDRDKVTMAKLRAIARSSNGMMTIENPNREFKSFWMADLMVSDWSGVALEYAFCTERPVVFIDAPRKVSSVDLLKLNLPAVEESLRSEVGVIVDVNGLQAGINQTLSLPTHHWQQRIQAVRNKNIYNFKNSAKIGTETLIKISERSDMLSEYDMPRERILEFIDHYFN